MLKNEHKKNYLVSIQDQKNNIALQKHKTGNQPVAVIQNGTTAAEKLLVADLNTIVEQVDQYGIQNPAVLIFGMAANDPITSYKNWVQKEAVAL